jgi:peptidoglycan hydrolase-like protein with peptidoglycan-binding domain
MAARGLSASLLTIIVAAGMAQPAAAGGGGGEAFVGGLLGSAIGTAIVNHQQQRRPVVVERRYVTKRAPAPVVNSWQREQNRQVQTALNYFGFPAGVADGVLGANSRAAIGQYQAFLGYPATGVLSEYERAFLTSSYDRALVGGPQAAQIMASGQGTRGLLLAWRQEQMGVPPAAPTMPAVAAAPAAVAPPAPEAVAPPAPAAAPAPIPQAVTAATTPAEEPADAPAAPEGGLPSFLPGAAAASIDSYCNRINLATSTNGGFVTVAAMSDPGQALGEQFCLARTYAIEQGDSLAGTVQGFSMAEMETQCDAFAPSMTGYQSRLAAQDPAEVRAALKDFVSGTGMPPAQLSGSARICLGIGYRTDDAEVALASALVLVGLGEEAYDEILGHHLINGFATPKRSDRGLEWLGAAAEALAAGASPLVTNGAQTHAALLEQAVAELSGTATAPVLQDAAAPAPLKGLALPTAPAAAASN